MIDDYDKIISRDVSLYVQEVCCAYGNSSNNITQYPLIEYLMSSVLLRMTGFMEQKLDILQLILCHQDEDLKYNLLHKSNKLSSSYQVVSSIYKSFRQIILIFEKDFNVSERKKYDENLFGNIKCILNAYEKIYNIFKDSSIVYPIKRNFDDFLNLKNRISNFDDEQIQKIQEELKNQLLSKEERKRKGETLNALVKKNKTRNRFRIFSLNDYIYVYRHTINFRHSIAHNIISIRKDLPNISAIKSNNFQYENYFIRFMIVLSIDEVIRDMYKYYKALQDKYLF